MIYEDYLAEEEFLCHYGILGQKWGIRRTPEQLGHYVKKKQVRRGELVNKAEEARHKGNTKQYEKAMKKIMSIDEDIKKAGNKMPRAQLREEQQKEKEAKKREEYLRKASPEEILKNADKLSDDELRDVMARFNKTNDIVKYQRQTELDKMKNTQDKINMAIGFADTLVKGFNKYEDIARVVNKITGDETLTVFSDKGKKEREAIINSLDYNKIMANRNKLSGEELNKALDNYHKARGENRSKAIKAMQDEIAAAGTSVSVLTSEIGHARARQATAETRKTTAEAAHTTATTNYETAKQNARTAEREMNDAKKDYRRAVLNADPTASSLRTAWEAKRNAYNTAKADERTAKDKVKETKREVQDAKEAYENSKANTSDLERQRDAANEFIRQRRQEVWRVGQEGA